VGWPMKPLMILVSVLPPLPRRHRLRISPQASLGFSCCLLQLFEISIPWCIFSLPPAPAVFGEHLIDVGAIGQDPFSNRALVLVEAKRLKCDLIHR